MDKKFFIQKLYRKKEKEVKKWNVEKIEEGEEKDRTKERKKKVERKVKRKEGSHGMKERKKE